MAQVWTTTLEKKTPPSSNNGSDDEGFMSRNLDRGLRMAQLTGSAMLTAFNLTETGADVVLSPVISSALDLVMNNPSNENIEEENVEEEEEEQGAQVLRERSRSRDDASPEARVLRDSDDENMGHRLLRKRSK